MLGDLPPMFEMTMEMPMSPTRGSEEKSEDKQPTRRRRQKAPEGTPAEFICCVDGSVMAIPVCSPYGHTFEQQVLYACFCICWLSLAFVLLVFLNIQHFINCDRCIIWFRLFCLCLLHRMELCIGDNGLVNYAGSSLPHNRWNEENFTCFSYFPALYLHVSAMFVWMCVYKCVYIYMYYVCCVWKIQF